MLKPFFDLKGVPPYIIHAQPLELGEPLFPVHTHGLVNIGMPEFIFDPLAFGPQGNAARINLSFDFFIDPQNFGLLDRILKGEIIKLPAIKLCPEFKSEPFTYCYREVCADFEAVKQAYGDGIKMEIPEIRFVQIWVDGDDYALTDEYYRGGVTY